MVMGVISFAKQKQVSNVQEEAKQHQISVLTKLHLKLLLKQKSLHQT